MRMESPIGILSLQPSWSVSMLISSWHQEGRRWSEWPRMRPRRFPSLWRALRPILSRQAWLTALPVPAATSPVLQTLNRDLGGKRLELLKEAVPKLARVAVFYAPASPGSALYVKEDLPVAARALGLTIRSWEIRAADDFEKVFAALNKQRPDGLYVTPDALIGANQKRTIGFALESRLPSMYSNREAVDAGGLMYYGADTADSYRRVAYYVDRILKGSKPADLPSSNRPSLS